MGTYRIHTVTNRKPVRALDAAAMSWNRGCELISEPRGQRLPNRLEPPV